MDITAARGIAMFDVREGSDCPVIKIRSVLTMMGWF